MRREALTAALCWFTIGGALPVKTFGDNESAESVSRLYRNLQGAGVYASAAPYGAYSFQIPLVAAPNTAASKNVPVKENYVFHNMNAHLKDSYGNRFVEPSHQQQVAFKPFPQQYVQLQELPAHFAQPLAAPSFSYKQNVPQIIVGSHYRLPLQAAQTPIKQQFGFPQGTYAGNVKSLAPPSILHSQFSGPFHLPGQAFNFGSPQPQVHQRTAPPPPLPQTQPLVPNTQQQSTSNEAVYANTHSEEQYHSDEQEAIPPAKFERLPEASRDAHSEEELSVPSHQQVHHNKGEQKPLPVPIRETTITSVLNGKKTRVNLKTKPLVPLLDISLLEPLTFDNPLVPQVQHFLPRLNQATYHKLPELTQNVPKKHQKPHGVHTKTYDSGVDKVKTKKFTPKKKQKYPRVEIQNSYYDEIPSASTVKPTITIKGTPNESPEFSYEINSPNYKETYKEQAINYNKETNSEPVHITYGSEKHEEPVHYSYVHSSKEPVHIKEVHYESKGESPKHLTHNSKPQQHQEENHDESNDSEESSEDDSPQSQRQSEHRDHHKNEHDGHQNQHREHHQHHDHHHSKHNDQPHRDHDHHKQHHNEHNQQENHHNQHHNHHNQHYEPTPTSHHQKPEHREEEYHHKPSSTPHQNVQHEVHSYNPTPVQYYTKTGSGFQPVQQFEEEIRIAAPIKVNPNQHVQVKSEPRQQPHSSPTPHTYQHSPSPGQFHQSAPQPKHPAPTTHVQQKTKQILIQEESPEHIMKMFVKDDDSEKDFETAYKNAAFGFPAFGKSIDLEKDIYNPENYGVPRDDSYFDSKHSPFQQYHEPNDNFPKSSRLGYKDDRDKTKEDYFLDYSVSKPESLTDYHKKKVDYIKMYKKQKPERYVAYDDDNNKKQQTSEKYTAIPYNFYPTMDQNYFAQYKMSPFVQEYDYSKGAPRDNSAHASKPTLRYNKGTTFFVEPQFQYGFEPISIPRLLDSELATMASNDSPESEKPGMRKKIYKENFYIKKTSMSEAGPNS